MNAITGGSYTLEKNGDLKLVERTLDPAEVAVEEAPAEPPAKASKAKAAEAPEA